MFSDFAIIACLSSDVLLNASSNFKDVRDLQCDTIKSHIRSFVSNSFRAHNSEKQHESCKYRLDDASTHVVLAWLGVSPSPSDPSSSSALTAVRAAVVCSPLTGRRSAVRPRDCRALKSASYRLAHP